MRPGMSITKGEGGSEGAALPSDPQREEPFRAVAVRPDPPGQVDVQVIGNRAPSASGAEPGAPTILAIRLGNPRDVAERGPFGRKSPDRGIAVFFAVTDPARVGVQQRTIGPERERGHAQRVRIVVAAMRRCEWIARATQHARPTPCMILIE